MVSEELYYYSMKGKLIIYPWGVILYIFKDVLLVSYNQFFHQRAIV